MESFSNYLNQIGGKKIISQKKNAKKKNLDKNQIC